MPLYTLVGTTVRGELLKSRAKMEDIPRLTAMGIFSSSITKKLPNRIKLIIQSLCSLCLSRLHTGGLVAHHVDQILDRMEHQEDGADGQQMVNTHSGQPREKVSLPVLI